MKALLDDRARANEVRYTAEQNAGADGDERPALHWSVRAATAQREALGPCGALRNSKDESRPPRTTVISKAWSTLCHLSPWSLGGLP
jgi:hypothetical protein